MADALHTGLISDHCLHDYCRLLRLIVTHSLERCDELDKMIYINAAAWMQITLRCLVTDPKAVLQICSMGCPSRARPR